MSEEGETLLVMTDPKSGQQQQHLLQAGEKKALQAGSSATR
jgi:hypothetical protein